MTVKDAVSRRLVAITPRTTLRGAALKMKKEQVGILPVLKGRRPIGILTDRDIVVRGLAEGKDPRHTRVREIMTPHAVGCQDTQDIEKACNLMEEYQVRRLVVVDRKGEIVGLLSLDDVARKTRRGKLSGIVLHEISTKRAAGI